MGSMAASQLQGLQSDPELSFLTVGSCACSLCVLVGFSAGSQVSSFFKFYRITSI